jgi:macrolide transport system ATP-binding/permease protein
MNPLQWLWSALRRKDDLSEELESHLQMAIADRIARGESASEARRAATHEFGNVPLIADVTRERWGWLRLEHLLRDLQFAVRQMRRSPGFSITAVLTLALGIGALTTVATWSDAVLYSPWPRVEAPRELRFVDATVLGNSGYSVHYDNYRFMRESGHSWKDAVAFAQTQVNLTEPGTEPRAFTAGLVSSNYFQFLGISPQSGRFFQPNANDRAYGANDEIVLSDALWRDRFNADSSIAGRAISINGHPFTVVGIVPKEFAGIFGGVAEAAWIRLSGLRGLSTDSPPDPLLHYGLQVAVRLHPGVNDASAAAELHALAHAFALQQHGDNGGRWDWNLRDAAHFQRGLFNMVGSQLPVLLGASGLLMMLVCINIASLLGSMRPAAVAKSPSAPRWAQHQHGLGRRYLQKLAYLLSAVGW